MRIEILLAGIPGIIFAIMGIFFGATIFGAICYTNAILLLIYIELNSPKNNKTK